MSSAPTASAESTGKAGSVAQQDRRRRILDATMQLASEGGFDAVQMRAVADRAEVALGTLYRYFPSKIHLLVSALDTMFVQAEARTASKAIPGDTPHERVMFLLSRQTKALQKEPQLTEALVRAFMFADASVSAEIHQVGMRLTSMISRAIAGSPDHSEADPDEAAVIRVISDVWLSALVGWVTGRTDANEVVSSMDVAVRLLLR